MAQRVLVRRRLNKLLLSGMALSFGGLGLAPAMASTYPDRPIRMIVSYPPGGGADAIGRLVAGKLQEALGQPIIVENRAGASQVLGTETLARAAPDGYTIGLITDSHVFNPYFIKELPYDSEQDFQVISQVAIITMMLVAKKDLGVSSVQALVDRAKANPGKLTFASTGNGSPHQLSMEWFKSMADIDLLHVPYRGAAPALTDVVGGQVDVMFASTASVAPFIASGNLVPLAVSSAQRSAGHPEVPTLAESGYPEYAWGSWFGIAAPKGLPSSVLERLHSAVVSAVNDPQVVERLAGLGVQGATSASPSAFAQHIRDESVKVGRIVKEANLQN